MVGVFQLLIFADRDGVGIQKGPKYADVILDQPHTLVNIRFYLGFAVSLHNFPIILADSCELLDLGRSLMAEYFLDLGPGSTDVREPLRTRVTLSGVSLHCQVACLTLTTLLTDLKTDLKLEVPD